MKKITIALNVRTWQVLQAMLMDDPMPRRTQYMALQELDAALKAVNPPPATETPDEP
jgi:hypothetical protein